MIAARLNRMHLFRLLPFCLCTLTLTAGVPAEAKKKHKMTHLKRVVLDPGHGGKNMGTPGAHGIHEKFLTLPITLHLEKLLVAGTDAKVTLTRRADVHIGLRERTRIANAAKGDIFFSIHLNSSPRAAANGVQVYFLSPDAADEEIERLVAREEADDDDHHGPAGGPNESKTPFSIDQILKDAQLYRAHKQAELVAGVTLDTMHKVMKAPRRGVHQAPFGVLKEAEMPAVVVEVGFLTHAIEGKKLTTTAYQRKIAKSLYKALITLDKRLTPR